MKELVVPAILEGELLGGFPKALSQARGLPGRCGLLKVCSNRQDRTAGVHDDCGS
jgi:hypothetical protein